MTGFTIILLALGLAMDAFAVSLSNGMCYSNYTKKYIYICAFSFGIFQGLMPILGFYTAIFFKELIVAVDHWIALVLLGYLGIKMIRESFDKCKNSHFITTYSIKICIIQSIATSIDALAVGISFAALNIDIYSGSLVILIITTICCIIGGFLGKRFYKLSKYSTVIGGLILIFIGVKIFIEHTS